MRNVDGSRGGYWAMHGSKDIRQMTERAGVCGSCRSKGFSSKDGGVSMGVEGRETGVKMEMESVDNVAVDLDASAF